MYVSHATTERHVHVGTPEEITVVEAFWNGSSMSRRMLLDGQVCSCSLCGVTLSAILQSWRNPGLSIGFVPFRAHVQ